MVKLAKKFEMKKEFQWIKMEKMEFGKKQKTKNRFHRGHTIGLWGNSSECKIRMYLWIELFPRHIIEDIMLQKNKKKRIPARNIRGLMYSPQLSLTLMKL